MFKWTVAAIAVLSFAISSIAAPNAATNKVSAAKRPDPPNGSAKLEQEVLAELNLARQKPQEYAKILEAHRKLYRADNAYSLPDGTLMATQEGVKAVDEAIAYLKKAGAIGPLAMSAGLSLAARDHAEDIGPKGAVGHAGSDGSDSAKRVKRYGEWEVTTGENISFGYNDARLIVMQLIVDDGVPGRGHRTNIFLPKYRTVGIACGEHKILRHLCVMDFAGGFKENKAARNAAKKDRP